MSRILIGISLIILLSGCYHARITISDSRPSVVVLDDPWADAWVYGLVPPDEIDATDKCESGVATVETRLSFLNQLVGGLTLGIYTPMHVRITCAD
jgi:hypothetical protein